MLSNGSSGFSTDLTGKDNSITVSEWGLEVAGDRNLITLGGSTQFEGNGSGAILLSGNDNRLDLGGLDITAVDSGSGNIIV
ncbi:MAG: hypothetical protein F6J97_08485 [Leptolyngbya sp. SIO4C1]|nr:hypothetical protein [Leptolyngbya sp. SIO4C1]